MLLLKEADLDLPDHVHLDADGIAYTEEVVRRDEPLPARFGGPARPDDPDGPPWSTLVCGLETGRDGLRERFVAALVADAAAGHPVGRYGDALESSFRDLFGGRGATADAASFLGFVQEALAAADRPDARAQLARGERELLPRSLDERIARAGAAAVAIPAETGHEPADHAEVLYWLAALVPGWTAVHFAQVVSPGEDEPELFELQAWCAGKAFVAPARNLGDRVDLWSCAGFLNVLLREVLRTDVRVHLTCEDEGAIAVAGPAAVLAQLRVEGVIGSESSEDD